MTFDDLRYANVQRNKEWDPDQKIGASFRGLEFAGEAGELCNMIKKLERERMGIPGSRITWFELAQELADCYITLDLIGMHYGIDAEGAIRLKFNATSEKMKLATRIR